MNVVGSRLVADFLCGVRGGHDGDDLDGQGGKPD